MNNIKIRDNFYKIVEDKGNTVNEIDFLEIVTDYYDNFDYIVGDWAYNKVRLKGFYKSDNKLVKDYNDIAKLDSYIENSCAYGCKYFVLEKITEEEVEKES